MKPMKLEDRTLQNNTDPIIAVPTAKYATSKHLENRRPDDHTNHVEKLRGQNDYVLFGFPCREGLRDSQVANSPPKKSRDSSKEPFFLFSPDNRAQTGAFTGSTEDSEVRGGLMRTPVQKKRIDNFSSLPNEVENV